MHEDFSLGELAVRFGLELRGSPDTRVSHVATLAQAPPGSLSFLADSRHRRELATTRASAVVLAVFWVYYSVQVFFLGACFCAALREREAQSKVPA